MSTNTTNVDFSPEYMAQSCGSALIIISALFITLDTIFVALRFYGHSLAHVSLGLDDLIIPVAWLTHVGLCILGIVLVTHFGAGHHFDYLSQDHPDQVVAWAKSMYASQWLYPVCVALPKISILLSYLRVIIDKPTRIACHVLIWILVVNMLAYMIASAVQCIPLEYIWDLAITGTCFNIGAFWTSTSVPNFVTDLLMLLLPLKTIAALKVSRWSKAGMAFIFLSGGMGIIISAYRMVVLFKLMPFFNENGYTDNTWVGVKLDIMLIIEPGMYLVAASSLRMRPVVMKCVGRLRNTDSRPYGDGSRMTGPSHGGHMKLQNVPSVQDDQISIQEISGKYRESV